MFNNFRVGDRLVRSKDVFFKHHGIYIGYRNGQHFVAENNTPHGVRIVSYETFLNGNRLERVEPHKGNEYQRKQVIPFIESKLGTNYDLLAYNCEHFAHEVQTGQPKSYQVQWGFGAAAATFLWFVFKPQKTC